MWSFTKIWNDSVDEEVRKVVPRDYAWASELGKPLIDRYLTMKGVQPSNPPNTRSKRKFFAGNVWEFVAGIVLYQLGIVQDKQQEVWVEDTAIRVKGKIDYLAGGKPNYSKARDYINSLPFDKELMSYFQRVIDKFEQSYGDTELELMVHEIKSVSEYVIDKINGGGRIPAHDLQIYHYLRGLNMNHGRIDYISKNDSLMAEVAVTQTDVLKQRYENDLLQLKGYLDTNEKPKPAPLILWENKFVKNFGVEYSNYLTLVYGFERPDQYSDSVKTKIASWNRAIKRIKDIDEGNLSPSGKQLKLTEGNEAAINEISAQGYDPYELAKVAQVEETEE